MAYRIAGTYVAVCDCAGICPCPVDGPPTGDNGECLGSLVFDIKEGDLDGTDLSGTTVALYNHLPSYLAAGNWTVGLVIDAAYRTIKPARSRRSSGVRRAARSGSSQV